MLSRLPQLCLEHRNDDIGVVNLLPIYLLLAAVALRRDRPLPCCRDKDESLAGGMIPVPDVDLIRHNNTLICEIAWRGDEDLENRGFERHGWDYLMRSATSDGAYPMW